MDKCGKWWRTRSEQIDERCPATRSDTSSEPSSDIGMDDSQVLEDIEVDINEPAFYEWEQPEGKSLGTLEATDKDLFSQTDDLKPYVLIENYHGAAQVVDTGPNLFDQLWDSDEYYECRKLGRPYYPFAGYIEWEVVQWLNSLDVPMEKIDRFFDLSYVSFMQFSYCLALTRI